MARKRHPEHHASQRNNWLRAAVLGSNDAIVSTTALMLGVGAADASRTAILVAGIAGLVSGAMSMGVGEYISVSAQHDAEEADIEREREEQLESPQGELVELAGIYVKRGLDRELAMQVATQLMAKDSLGAHLRDELGIEESRRARPLQAALASIASFAIFATLPIIALLVAPAALRLEVIGGGALAALAGLGLLGAKLAEAPLLRGVARVVIGGGLAMAASIAIGRLLGVVGL